MILPETSVSLALRNVCLRYSNGHEALRRITLSVRRGEHVAIIGPSGAGKTSLMRLLGLSLRPDDGHVEVLARNPWELSARALRQLRSRIGTVHQQPPIPGRQRVITAILAGRLGVWPWWKSMLSLLYPADIDGAEQTLARLGLADRLFERCDRLSGGQLQRVGIARVLYQQPDLILADEPVSSMDPQLASSSIQQLVSEAVHRSVTLVVNLHAVDLALHWFPRIIGLKAGEIAFDLPPARLTPRVLCELYASETSTLPMQGPDSSGVTLSAAASEARRLSFGQ